MFKAVPSDLFSDLEEMTGYRISRTDPYHRVIAYYCGEMLCGFIDYSIIYEKSELNFIYVKEEYRKKGIASLLMNYWLEQCVDIESETLEVAEDNREAFCLYRKFGFEGVSLRPNYYGSKNGILMVRGSR